VTGRGFDPVGGILAAFSSPWSRTSFRILLYLAEKRIYEKERCQVFAKSKNLTFPAKYTTHPA
jgi:hypothetical protein